MLDEDEGRRILVRVGWIGMPYHPGADLRGVGVDCGMLRVRVYVAMTASTRRAALGAILTAPLTGGAVMAVPSDSPQPAAPVVSPELLRLIAMHDRINAILDEEADTDDLSLPSYGTMRAAPPPPGCLRHPVSGRSPRQG